MNKWEENKKRIYHIIEAAKDEDIASKSYDIMMLVAVVIGLIPLTLKTPNIYTTAIDITTSILFLIDYIIRLWTADYKMGIKCKQAYIAYIVSPMAIVDLLSIIPILSTAFPALRLFQYFRIIRVARLLKLIRYSSTFRVVENIFRKIKQQLLAILMLVVVYILAISMIMFNVEPDMFDTFLDAVYWSSVSITTIGYGDITPITVLGKIITIISSLVGVGVIALPSALVTASYMEEIKKKKGKHEI